MVVLEKGITAAKRGDFSKATKLSANTLWADRYDLAEFYSRVGARAGLKSQDATERTGRCYR